MTAAPILRVEGRETDCGAPATYNALCRGQLRPLRNVCCAHVGTPDRWRLLSCAWARGVGPCDCGSPTCQRGGES